MTFAIIGLVFLGSTFGVAVYFGSQGDVEPEPQYRGVRGTFRFYWELYGPRK